MEIALSLLTEVCNETDAAFIETGTPLNAIVPVPAKVSVLAAPGFMAMDPAPVELIVPAKPAPGPVIASAPPAPLTLTVAAPVVVIVELPPDWNTRDGVLIVTVPAVRVVVAPD